MNLKNRKIICLLLMVSLISSSFTCFASVSNFRKVLVDSNSYNEVTAATKSLGGVTTGVLELDAIYKADGSASNYSRVYAKTSFSASGVVAVKGRSTTLTIYPGMLENGDRVTLLMKGYNSSLDCRVSGYWDAN